MPASRGTATPSADGADAERGGTHAGGVRLVVLLMAPFFAQADATIANVATPSIRSGWHVSGAAAELVVGGYLIAYAALLITGARLGQTHGYKRLFLLGMTVFGLSSLAAGLAPTVLILIIARVVQGAGAAMMYPQSLTGIQLTSTGQARTRAVSLFAIALAGGAVIGQLLGGILISANIAGTAWRPVFLINIPIVAAVLIAGQRHLPDDSDRHTATKRSATERSGDAATARPPELDLPGAGVLTLAALLIVVPLIVAPPLHWPIWAWLMLIAAAPTCWLFVRSQSRRAVAGHWPLVNVAVVRRTPVLAGLAALLLATATYFALLFVLAQYVQQGLHRNALASGLILIPWVAAFGLAGQITRRLPARITPLLPTTGYLLLTGAYAAIAAVVNVTDQLSPLLYVLLWLGGLGLGTGFATLISHLTNSVHPDHAPDISGVTSTTLQIGGAIGVAAFGSIYLNLASRPAHALTITAAALAATSLTAAAAASIATRTRH